MRYDLHSFRHAQVILQQPDFISQYKEIISVLDAISDAEIISQHLSYGQNDISKTPKSISRAINELLKQRLINSNWNCESAIFQNLDYTGDTWRLDFAKDDLSIEVAFNHSTVIAWNLIKPVLASALNHVAKAIQTQIGIIITAKRSMKKAGGFDNAIGTYEKFLDYLPPLQNLLTTPLLIVGLEEPASFKIEHFQQAPRKKIGRVVYL